MDRKIVNCNTCSYLIKRSGVRTFVYTCSKWGLISGRYLPWGIIKTSIGRECPFYTVKRPENGKQTGNNENTSGTGGINITI